MHSKYSRRKFIKHNTLTGIGAVLSIGIGPSDFALSPPKKLIIKPRYHRWHVNAEVEWLEKNTTYATIDWSIPLGQTALVLVDVWQRHYLKNTGERGEKIIQEKLVPLIDAGRNLGIKIIHSPFRGTISCPMGLDNIPICRANSFKDSPLNCTQVKEIWINRIAVKT